MNRMRNSPELARLPWARSVSPRIISARDHTRTLGWMNRRNKQCIIDNLGFMPDKKANEAQSRMRMIGEACLAGERGDNNHRSPGQGNGPN